MRYGPRRSAVATRVGFTGWGPFTISHIPGSISEAGPVRSDPKAIHDQVHALNESVQRQLEEANRRYMELYQCHERDTQQWRQQLQSME